MQQLKSRVSLGYGRWRYFETLDDAKAFCALTFHRTSVVLEASEVQVPLQQPVATAMPFPTKRERDMREAFAIAEAIEAMRKSR